MLELIEKTLLTGIGFLSLSQKKVEELVEDLKEKMNLTEEEGKKLMDRLRDAAKENQQKLEAMAQDEVKKACDRLGVITEEEFTALKMRVEALENQLTTPEN